MIRKLSEIQAAEKEMLDRCWYARTMAELHFIECHHKPISDEAVFDSMMEHVKALEAKYGVENLLTSGEYEDGVVAGKLAALRYVLGADWSDEEILDT